jgi:diguanylate cyclase (GGDEF)-like protein
MIQQDSTNLNRQIEPLASRDWQLWSIAALVVVIFAIGVVCVAVPNVITTAALHSDSRYLPQLFFGMIVLIFLFNIYIFDQKRELKRARAEMVQQSAECARAQELAIIDPLTNLFNRRYMEEIIPKEQARADRGHREISFLIIDCDDFKGINTRFGHFGGDIYLKDFARLLKTTFRGSDTILRMGGDEFMVILPETSNAQAGRAAERLRWEVDWRNQASQASYQLAFSCGIATYQAGRRMDDVLREADDSLYRAKRESRGSSSNAARDVASKQRESRFNARKSKIVQPMREMN